MLRAFWWLLVIAATGAVGWGYFHRGGMSGYSDAVLVQLDGAQLRQIYEAHLEADRKHLALERSGVVDGKTVEEAARLQVAISEAEVVRAQIRTEQMIREWRGRAGLLVLVALGLALAGEGIRVARRRRMARAAQSAPVQFSAADPEESWARRTLSLGAFATLDEVEAAFRDHMVQYHPDKVAHLGPDLRKLADEKARDITRAREVLRRILSVPGKR